MSLVMICLALLCLAGLKTGIRQPVDDYISPKGTLAVKGLFVVIVFLSHSIGYVSYGTGIGDVLMTKTCSALNQLMVVPFFFYSGYGIGFSSAVKKDYGKGLPLNRILPLFLKFSFAVLLYLGAAAVTGTRYSTYEILSAFIGWESVGNSNWFIFATFALYVSTFISLSLFKDRRAQAAGVTVLTFVYIGAMIAAGRPVLWYDTVLAFPFGVWFSLYKDRFDLATEKLSRWAVATALCAAGFLLFWYLFKVTDGSPVSAVALIFKSLFFALGLALITRRFSPRSKILSFFGRHVFGIYILQRLPMLLLSRFAPHLDPRLFAAAAFAATVVIAFLFEKYIVPERLTARLRKKKDKAPS